MGKNKPIFVCRECGYESNKWLGKCPSCGAWNSFVEYTERGNKGKREEFKFDASAPPTPLNRIDFKNVKRFKTGIGEFDRVLGGGIVPGAVILIGGEPGIGKSTILIQVANKLARKGINVLYSTSEESLQQVSLRANRTDSVSENILLSSEYSVNKIIQYAEKFKPGILIVDSIQTIYDEETDAQQGSVNSIKACTSKLIRFAKATNIPVFVVGHVTKGGIVAGPKILEHMVDAVIYLEGDSNHGYRVLRNAKNRYGSTDEIGLFEMHESGLIEVNDPSEIFLTKGGESISGTVLTATIEGSRPMLVEIQAIAAETKYGVPQRSVNGPDYKRVSTLIAVLEKRLHLFLGNQDIFLNVVGGLKIKDPGIDLAVLVAIYSSYSNKAIGKNMVFIGEVGLGGELRSIEGMKRRVEEAVRFGIKNIVIPRYIKEKIDDGRVNIIKCNNVNNVMEYLRNV